MRSIKAIFKKQVKDIKKNMAVLIQFALFPIVALIMTEMVVGGDAFAESPMPDTMFVTMFSAIFVGMALIPTTAGIIAEDREKKCLRFLVMAGVKPSAYLLGIGGVIFMASLLPSMAFGLIGGFQGVEFWLFMAAMMSGVIASTLFGLTIGMFAKNQQAAVGLAMPFAIILGFGPMIALFNEQVAQIFGIFYTQQLDVILNSFYSVIGYQSEVSLWQSFGIIWANVIAMVALFVLAFTKKGLKG